MEISGNIISAILGSVFGAGGLGGVLVMMAKNKETDAETLRAYCAELRADSVELRAHQKTLEARIDSLEVDKITSHRENSILLAERAIDRAKIETLESERAADRAKIDALEVRLNDFVSHAVGA